DINIWVWPVGTPPAEFDFRNRMATARTAWSNALGISFTPVGNMYSANIRAYGGRRTSVQDRVGERNGPYLPIDHRYGVHLNQTGSGGIAEGRVRAGGVERSVFRLTGSGTSAEIIAVFSDSGSWLTTDARNINFATMTAIHELGHALGYMGHSPNANDVMRGAPPMLSPNETLRPAEIEHLRQIYRRFR
ncbi:MAG: hypothetical protein FWC73_13715, partial [Defluviitaleaceae bacterium]|nr:hypothetical protein [Defluviitaleaceae bacterium]